MAGIFSNKKLEAARAAAEAEASAATAVGAATAPNGSYDGAASYATAAPVAPAAAPGDNVRQSLSGKYVCPFCGSVNENEQGTCPRCTMENTAASRKATKVRIGPWYVLQTRNPAAPGMKFETLLSFVKKGRVKPTSIVRGPTTHQLWRFAAQVKGLSREFGVCYSCGASIDRTAGICPQCNRAQDPPPNPDVLLESGKEGAAPAATATAPGATGHRAPANGAAPAAAANTGRPPEPSLESGEEEFVIPAIGGGSAGGPTNLSDSMAGFSMSDSLAGTVIDQPWARIDPNRAANGPAGNGRGPAGRASPPPRQPLPAGPGPAAYNPTTGYTPASAAPGQGAPYGYAEPPYRQPPGAGPRRPASPATGGAGFGGNGGRPQPQRAEGFLSARDLAAAFKLQLADDGNQHAAPAAAAAAPRSPYASPPAADFGPADPDALFNPPSFRRPRGRKRKIVIVLLLMALAAVGIALAVSEDFRQTTAQWFSRAKAELDADPSKAEVTGKNLAPADSAATADASKSTPRGAARPASGRLPGTTQPAAPATRPTSSNRAGQPQANGIFADPESRAADGSETASLSAHTASPEVTTTTTAASRTRRDGWDAIPPAAAAAPSPPSPATRPADSRKTR
jgi:hypothetical protein